MTLGSPCITTGINVVPVTDNNLMVVPNPTTSNITTLKITTPSLIQNLQIQIIDAAGKLVYASKATAAAGTSSIPINITKLAKGKYFVSVYNNDKLIGTRELVKL
jgi:hypothetical protein